MIVRTMLGWENPESTHFNGKPARTLLQQIEQDPKILSDRALSPTPNCFFFHTINELLNEKEDYIKQVTEVKNAGYDIAWYSNSTCDIRPYGGIPIEYFEYQAGAYHEEGIATEIKQWNCIDKGLYQPGKTTKEVRLAILKYLDDANLLHKLDYSLRVLDPNDPTVQKSFVKEQQNCIKRLGSTLEYFLNLNRSMDIDMQDICANGLQHYVGYPYQNHIYENTGWSLITESNTGFNIPNPYSGTEHTPGWNTFQDSPMISEKTYRPIMNSHPFVMIGEWGLHEHLNSLGYYTFEKFYGVNLEEFYPFGYVIDGRKVQDDYKAIQNVISQFYNNISANQDEVREMVTHNKQVLISNYNKTKQQLLDTNEYIIGSHGDHVMSLHNFMWQGVSYRNNNGKDLAVFTQPEKSSKQLLINIDQLK